MSPCATPVATAFIASRRSARFSIGGRFSQTGTSWRGGTIFWV
jgi:hypothetical protein